MRSSSWLIAAFLVGCSPRPPAPTPPQPATEAGTPVCPPGMFSTGAACSVIDPPCPPGKELSFGLGCVNAGEAPTPVPLPSSSHVQQLPDLSLDDAVVGKGAEAVPGTTLLVHYTGTLEDGQVVDSSWQRGEPFKFNLGAGQVIRGWEEGIVGMRVGGKRKLVIGPSKAYGDRGAPPKIPARATLVFVVDLLEVRGRGGAAP